MRRVLLAQHAKAFDKEDDPNRPLTPEGEKDATQVAELLKEHIASLDTIYHSGKLRAAQTANIFCEIMSPSSESKEIKGLKPLDDPKIIADMINSEDTKALFVGHLPHMPKLAGTLVNGSEDNKPVKFNNGGIVSLIQENDGWQIDWIVTPSIVGKSDSTSMMFA